MSMGTVLTDNFCLERQKNRPLVLPQSLSEAFPLYARLEELAANENNHVILAP